MSEIAYLTAAELARRIRERELSAREALDLLLDRIEQRGKTLNAVVTLDVDGARRRAADADAALARGELRGPLHGVPMTIKDTLETAGIRTTAGYAPLADHVPSADATAVARIRAAGANVFGKTNVPVLASDWQSFNPIFGKTDNPWNAARTPGGSSGGSAAAVAAGLTPLEIGSDIAGSIRVPAHWCGVYGHKPTHGIIPLRGHVPGPPGTLGEADLAVVGPLARDAADLELAVKLLAGPPADRAAAWRLALPPPRKQRLEDYRALAWIDDGDHPVDPLIGRRLAAAVETLRSAGVTVDEAAPADLRLGDVVEVYLRLLWPILTSGYPAEALEGLARVAATVTGKPRNSAERVACYGTARHHAWMAANEARERMRATIAETFARYDVVLMPVNQVTAIAHDHSQPMEERTLVFAGREREYLDLMAWIAPASALLLPATVAPIGPADDGMPVGLQIVGPYLHDYTTLDFARRASEVVGGFVAPPLYAGA